MIRKPILVLALLLSIQSVHSQKRSTTFKNDPVTISLDKVAFDENSYLSVLNEDNEVIAHYNRFENQSSSVKSVRVFDADKNLKYVLVPLITDNGYQVHIRDSNNSRGLVNLTASIDGF